MSYNAQLVAVAAATFILSMYFMRVKRRDPYHLFHLDLNRLPGQDPCRDPDTEWSSMGYWKDTEFFPEACEAMALKLIRAANCKSGGNVLDVGHGTGESLILQLSHDEIPRPAYLTGITSLRAQHERALRRIAAHSQQRQIQTRVVLYHGDAVWRGTEKGDVHPLDSASAAPPFTTILALDCAYHFDSRKEFLRQAFARLAPGGRIALADIAFTPAAVANPSLSLWAVKNVLGFIPAQNIISTERYAQDMADIGYVDVSLEDVTGDVFPSFSRFLKKRGVKWGIVSKTIDLYQAAGARFLIVTGTRPSL